MNAKSPRYAAIDQWQVAQCEWIDDRWHLDGRPIHAGSQMEMVFPDGTWQPVRIESEDAGRVLFAFVFHHKQPLGVKIGFTRKLRWPEEPTGRPRVSPELAEAMRLLAKIVANASPCTSAGSRMVDIELIERAAELAGVEV